MKIKFDPVGAQRDFFHDDTSKLLHLSAGFGFGKTTILLYKLLKLSKLNAPFHGGLVVPTYTDFKRDVMPAFETLFDKHKIKARFHGSDHYYNFPWTTGRLYIATAERKLRGPNWSYAGINELTLIPMIRYQEVIGRVRVKGAKAPQIVSSGTPEGIASEYYTAFVENPFKGSRILYGDTRENAHNLDAGYIENVLSSYPKALADAYIRGLWVNLAGNRFYFSYDPIKNDNPNIKYDESLPVLAGMDFNVHNFCISFWQRQGNKIRLFDEIRLDGGEGYDTKRAIQAMEAKGYGPYNTIIYPDPAGNARSTKGLPDIKILENHGYQCRVRKAAPRFRERQLNVNALFERGVIEINPACKGMKKDLMAVEQDKVTLEKRKNNPELTHFSDGMDYLIDIEFPFQGHRTKNESVKLR